MLLVVADTSPIFYLLSIDQVDLLQRLFGKIFIPDAVQQELRHPAAPAVLREWIVQLPVWVEVTPVEAVADAAFRSLGAGERDAITLALNLHADLLLMDERKGTSVALNKGLEVTGTLGILSLAARRGLVDLADCFDHLKRTNFRIRTKMMDALLAQHKGG